MSFFHGSVPGLYEFHTAVDADGVVYAEWAEATGFFKIEGVIAQASDKTSILVSTGADDVPAIGLTGVDIYVVEGTTVTAGTKDDLDVGDYVVVYCNATTGDVESIYILVDMYYIAEP